MPIASFHPKHTRDKAPIPSYEVPWARPTTGLLTVEPSRIGKVISGKGLSEPDMTTSNTPG